MDHENLIKNFSKNQLLHSALSNERKALNYAFWKEVKANNEYVEKERELEFSIQKNKGALDKGLSFTKNVGTNCCQSGRTMKEGHAKIQELNKKRCAQMAAFSGNMRNLVQKYESSCASISNDKVKDEIRALNGELDLIAPQIQNLQDEIEEGRHIFETSKKMDAQINVKEIRRVLEEESLKLFGDSEKYKKYISSIEADIHLLNQKIEQQKF